MWPSRMPGAHDVFVVSCPAGHKQSQGPLLCFSRFRGTFDAAAERARGQCTVTGGDGWALTSGTSTLSPGFSLPGGAVGASKLASASVAVLLSPSCPAACTHHRCCRRLCCRRAAVCVEGQQQGSYASIRLGTFCMHVACMQSWCRLPRRTRLHKQQYERTR